jgi:hypothetical protein
MLLLLPFSNEKKRKNLSPKCIEFCKKKLNKSYKFIKNQSQFGIFSLIKSSLLLAILIKENYPKCIEFYHLHWSFNYRWWLYSEWNLCLCFFQNGYAKLFSVLQNYFSVVQKTNFSPSKLFFSLAKNNSVLQTFFWVMQIFFWVMENYCAKKNYTVKKLVCVKFSCEFLLNIKIWWFSNEIKWVWEIMWMRISEITVGFKR